MNKHEVLRKMYGPAVANGIKYLDEHCPGWWEKIDTEKLDMDRPEDCICGQLGIGKVGVGTQDLGMSGEHGFFANDNYFKPIMEYHDIDQDDSLNEIVLKSVWVERINRRRRYHNTERPKNVLNSLCRTYVVGV